MGEVVGIYLEILLIINLLANLTLVAFPLPFPSCYNYNLGESNWSYAREIDSDF